MITQQAVRIIVGKSSNKQWELTHPVQRWLIQALLTNQPFDSAKTTVYRDISLERNQIEEATSGCWRLHVLAMAL